MTSEKLVPLQTNNKNRMEQTTNSLRGKLSNEELDERVSRAVENFMAGYGCCQAVVAAFADLYGLDDTMAKRIGAGFGGGVGRMRMMCGAVSGIVILVGLDCGQTEGSDREGIKGHEKAHSSYIASPRTAEYYKTRPCAAKVESAAKIFAEYLRG